MCVNLFFLQGGVWLLFVAHGGAFRNVCPCLQPKVVHSLDRLRIPAPHSAACLDQPCCLSDEASGIIQNFTIFHPHCKNITEYNQLDEL